MTSSELEHQYDRLTEEMLRVRANWFPGQLAQLTYLATKREFTLRAYLKALKKEGKTSIL